MIIEFGNAVVDDEIAKNEEELKGRVERNEVLIQEELRGRVAVERTVEKIIRIGI